MTYQMVWQNRSGDPELHRAGCQDVKRAAARQDGYVETIEAASVDDALETLSQSAFGQSATETGLAWCKVLPCVRP